MTERPTGVDTDIHQRLADLVAGQSVMGIFRALGTGRTLELANRAWDLGIDLVEVPVSEPEAWDTLEAVVAAGRERGRTVGAGTVVDSVQVERCAEIGVGFTVAPGLDPEVVRASEQAGIPHLPGVATPSEVQQARRLGCLVLKAFPASVLGPEWFAAIHGPFPDLLLVATGGVNASNAGDFLSAGAAMVALGSAFADESQLDAVAALTGTQKPR